MKTLFVIVLFFAIATRPVYQLGTIGYYQLHIDTIIEKYCVNKEKPKLQCNGKCYLSQQLLLESTTDTQNDENGIVEVFFPVFFQQLIKPNTSFNPIESFHRTWSFENTYSFELVNTLDPPPRSA